MLHVIFDINWFRWLELCYMGRLPQFFFFSFYNAVLFFLFSFQNATLFFLKPCYRGRLWPAVPPGQIWTKLCPRLLLSQRYFNTIQYNIQYKIRYNIQYTIQYSIQYNCAHDCYCHNGNIQDIFSLSQQKYLVHLSFSHSLSQS